jgi:choline-sulfatase
MTGWYLHVTGCRTNTSLLHPHQPSLFRYLMEDGYHIEWHGKNDLYSPDYFPLAVSRATGHQKLAPDDVMFNVHRSEPIVPLGEPAYHSFLSKPYEGDPEDFGERYNRKLWIDAGKRGGVSLGVLKPPSA